MKNSTIIAITNSKGGVGKTTTALNLGAALTAEGQKVLLIDNDPQGNLTAALGYTAGEMKHTLASLLLAAIDYPEDIAQHLQKAILHSDTGMDIIPANRRLADAAARLQIMQLSQYQPYGDSGRSCEAMLKHIADALRDTYRYIIIDCGLKHELLTVNALTAADSVIIPVQAEYFALEGISKLLNTIKIIKSKLNPALEIEGFLLTMYDSRLRQANQIYDEVKRHFQELVFNTVIQRNVKLSEAPSYGLPTILYDADSTGAKNHMALAKELISRNEKK